MRVVLSLLVPVSDWERKLGVERGWLSPSSWVVQGSKGGCRAAKVGAEAAPCDSSSPQGCRLPVPSLLPCLARTAACSGRALLHRTCSGCSVASISWAQQQLAQQQLAQQQPRAASWWRSHCPLKHWTCGQVSASRALLPHRGRATCFPHLVASRGNVSVT